jgi:uncharacterized protein with HEPN domain
MYDPETPRREWHFYIDDMIGFARKVLAYTANMEQGSFVGHGITCW